MDFSCPDITIFSHLFSKDSRFSRSLLLQAAQAYSGLTPQELGPIEVSPRGKPFFARQTDLHFSVTHSGDWWLCAFSKQPLGLDLQIHRSHHPPAKLSSRFFHPLEDEFLARENYRRFFDLWAAKESWVKYTGQGLSVGIKSFSVISSDGVFPSLDDVQLRLLPFAEGYSLCLCAQSIHEIRFLSLSDFKSVWNGAKL